MKLGKFVLTLASSFLLFSCGGNSSAASVESKNSSPADSSAAAGTSVAATSAASSAEASSPQDSCSCEIDSSSSVAADTSSEAISSDPAEIPSEESKSSSKADSFDAGSKADSSAMEASTAEEASSAAPIDTSIEIDPTLKDYIIFDRAPEIHFATEEGADLNWATTPNKNTDKPEVVGTITTDNCDDAFKIETTGKMKVRGNYTSNYRKKPFRINFDSEQNLFGLNEGRAYKKWVLLADVKDSSMMRNALAFYLGQTLLEDYFCPSFTPVHLYLNDSYWGMYLLVDNKEVADGRVEINEPGKKEKNVDTGYFFEYDCYWTEEAAKGVDGDPTFAWNDSDYIPRKITARASGQESDSTGYTISSKIRDRDETTGESAAQVPFLKNHLKNCYTVIYNAVFENKLQEILFNEGEESLVDSEEATAEAALAKTIDIDSFVNMYILNEICCDADIAHSSFYLSVDLSEAGNKKLTLTCPWDWDSSLGLKNNVVENASSMFASRCSNPWISMLTNCEWFMQKVQARWQGLLNRGFFAKALAMIDEYSAKYAEDYAMNFEKWPHTMGRNNVDNNVSNEVRSIYFNCTTEADAESLLKNWVTTRFQYLTNAFDGTVPPDNTSGGGGFPWNPGGGMTPSISTDTGEDNNGQEVADAFKAGKTPVVYEAEDAQFTEPATVKNPKNEGEVVSNNAYLAELNPNANILIQFSVNAEADCEALLSLRISRRSSTYRFDQFYTLSINGEEADSDDLLGIPLTGGTEEHGWGEFHNWTDWDIAIVSLDQGENTIALTTKNANSNLDYLAVYFG